MRASGATSTNARSTDGTSCRTVIRCAATHAAKSRRPSLRRWPGHAVPPPKNAPSPRDVRADEPERARDRHAVVRPDVVRVGHHEAVADERVVVAHDALGCAGRTRREEHEGEACRVDVGQLTVWRSWRTTSWSSTIGVPTAIASAIVHGGAVGEHERRLPFPSHERESLDRVVRVERDRHPTGGHHAEDRDDPVDSAIDDDRNLGPARSDRWRRRRARPRSVARSSSA